MNKKIVNSLVYIFGVIVFVFLFLIPYLKSPELLIQDLSWAIITFVIALFLFLIIAYLMIKFRKSKR